MSLRLRTNEMHQIYSPNSRTALDSRTSPGTQIFEFRSTRPPPLSQKRLHRIKMPQLTSMSSSIPVATASLRQDRDASSKNTEPIPIWLDHLPADICFRIILYIHPASLQGSSHHCRSLLSLAESSNFQRLAVLSALSHRLHVPKQADQAFWSRWGAVFGEDVHELSLLTVIPQTFNLLTAPNLHQASLLNVRTILSPLATAHQLRRLELNLIRRSSASNHETLSALRELKLESLSLFCDVHSVSACIFTPEPHIAMLSNFCQGLQAMKVMCFCNHKIHPTWRLFHRFPRLRQVAVDGRSLQSIADSHFDLLQTMHSVSLDGGDIGVEAALRIGVPVTMFRSSWAMERSKLAAIASCSRLTDLQICLTHGACSALPSLMKALPCLHSLHLRAVPRGRTQDVGFGNVLHAVANAANLCSLRLIGLRVDTRELVNVLKHLGLRLTEFETTVDEMDASQIGQIEALLETAGEFNTRLCKFDLVSTISAGKRPCHWPSISRRASNIRLSYERLRLKAPGLYSWSLEKYIHLIEHDVLHGVL